MDYAVSMNILCQRKTRKMLITSSQIFKSTFNFHLQAERIGVEA